MTDDVDELFGRKARGGFVDRYAPPIVTNGGAQKIEVPDQYCAFTLAPQGQAVESCILRRWVDGTNIKSNIRVRNRFLMRCEHIGDDEIRLLFPDCIAVLTGTLLTDEVADMLFAGQVAYVQQFHPKIWGAAPRDVPIVEKIDILKPTG